jgi:high-affinity iron transporter
MRRVSFTVSLISLVLLFLLSFPIIARAQDVPTDVTGITADARAMITQAMGAYRRGEFQSAFRLARAAYLDYFENAEPPLRTLNRDMVVDMEFKFAEMRSKMQLRRPPEEVEAIVGQVRDGLIEIDSMFDESGARLAPFIAGSTSFVIALRQGLEAILVIGVVMGALRASGARGMGRYVILGAAFAVLMSAGVWAALHTLLITIPVAQQFISAVAAIVAVLMLLWVNLWILRRLDTRYWLETMSARTWARMAAGNTTGFMLIGFSAFFRQGIETALTYETLISYSRRSEIYVLLGIAPAVLIMGIVAVFIARTGRRISPAHFLRLTLPLLALLSIAFIGGAVWQLQESGYVTVTSAAKVIPRLPYFIAALTGIHPTWETIGAQLGLLLIYLVAGAAFVLRRPVVRLIAERA